MVTFKVITFRHVVAICKKNGNNKGIQKMEFSVLTGYRCRRWTENRTENLFNYNSSHIHNNIWRWYGKDCVLTHAYLRGIAKIVSIHMRTYVATYITITGLFESCSKIHQNTPTSTTTNCLMYVCNYKTLFISKFPL